jgi:hypothetical protein
MEELDSKELFNKRPEAPTKLWCGRAQGLCSGNVCNICHMFPGNTAEHNSIISSPSLTDHKKIGLTRDIE